MYGLYIFVILHGFIFLTAGENITDWPVGSTFIYKICYTDSKHCIKCSQQVSVYSYRRPYEQKEYRVNMMDQLNRARSKYAIVNGISNMRFVVWISDFAALTYDMSEYGTPIIECNFINGTKEADLNYKYLGFKSETQLTRIEEREQVLAEQFQNLTSQLIRKPESMDYSLNEFACSYSYYLRKLKLTALMRCMLYAENRLNNLVLKFGKLCNGCDHTNERCIELDWYQGLCVFNRFNETRFRLTIEPETSNTTTFSIRIMFRISIYALNVIVLFLMVYVLYATCVVCRHNSRYGMTRISDNMKMEYGTQMVENIYNYE